MVMSWWPGDQFWVMSFERFLISSSHKQNHSCQSLQYTNWLIDMVHMVASFVMAFLRFNLILDVNFMIPLLFYIYV